MGARSTKCRESEIEIIIVVERIWGVEKHRLRKLNLGLDRRKQGSIKDMENTLLVIF